MEKKKKYPIGPDHYVLYEEIGQGVSASVHRALCLPFDEIVAIKILDFERNNSDLNNISREVQTMILIDHPNVLKSHCSFVSDHNLWVVMPFMAGGSCLHILKAAYPDGFEEVVIATILREVLKGLEYLHHHGHIHRDVKAGNILIDARGTIKLGDFGVSACLFDSGDRQRTRNTFVGTPCWMAPEVMEQLHGYDFKADIWSFGITALELAHGHAPFSKFPPMKVLLQTLQHAPPGLDYERDKKFSKSFKQMIASCLVKDPSKRPPAKKLLKHPFFKQARSNDYISRTLLEGLPALGDCMKALKRKEEDMLAQKKIPDGQMEELSQNEYKRGISGWNFNLEDMKVQASLIQDFDDTVADISQVGSSNSSSTLDALDKQSTSQNKNRSQIADMEYNDEMQNQSASVPVVDSTLNDAKFRCEDSDSNNTSSSHEQHFSPTTSPHLDHHVGHNLSEKSDTENDGRPVDCISSSILPKVTLPPTQGERKDSHSCIVLLAFDKLRDVSEKPQNQPQNVSNCNATIVPQTGDYVLTELLSKASKASAANSENNDEKAKVPVVQQRGRFKVTSEIVDLQKVITNATSLPSTLPLSSASDAKSSNLCGSRFPVLESALQTNILQRESVLILMKKINASNSTVKRAADGACTPAEIATIEKSLLEEAHKREKELLHEITELQQRLMCTQEELQKLKTESAQVVCTKTRECYVFVVTCTYMAMGTNEGSDGKHLNWILGQLLLIGLWLRI